MNWWSKIKKIVFFVLFLLSLIFFAFFILSGPPIDKIYCTLLGALGTGIDVRLFSHAEMPKSYEIIVNSPGGSQKIICPNDGATGEYSSKCTGVGAFVPDGFNYPPENYSVTVHANGKTFTRKMDPGSCQDASDTNGKGCPPFCYRASATIDLSP